MFKVTLIVNYAMYYTVRLTGLGIIIGLSTFSITPDYLKVVVSAACSVIIGLVLKLAYDWNKGPLTMKRITIQTAFSMGVGYIVFFLLDGHGWGGMKRQVILAFCSFTASHIVSALDTVGQSESRTFIQLIFERLTDLFHIIIAKKKPEEIKDEKKEK